MHSFSACVDGKSVVYFPDKSKWKWNVDDQHEKERERKNDCFTFRCVSCVMTEGTGEMYLIFVHFENGFSLGACEEKKTLNIQSNVGTKVIFIQSNESIHTRYALAHNVLQMLHIYTDSK